mgnify:CR=1 FL=1
MCKILLFLLVSLTSVMVKATSFQPSITDTQWQVTSSLIQCQLSQTIDNFGKVQFEQQAGKPFTLIFSTYSQPTLGGKVRFQITQAPWKNSEQRSNLKVITADKGQRHFAIHDVDAKQAFNQLIEGHFPSIVYQSQSSNSAIDVKMSTIHLSDYLPEFQQCLQNLLPYSFEQIQKLTINFDVGKSQLGDAEKKALSKLARYVNADPDIKQIRISGHTDNHGRRRLNEALSEARAVVVKNYLIKQCRVAKNLITTSHHMEFKPVKSNQTPIGRSYNRRSVVTLIR